MKKILFKISSFLILFMAFTITASAGSLVLDVTSSVKVGDSVIVTVRADSMAGKFSVTSSDSSVLSGGSSSDWIEGTTTYTFSARSAGSATITVTPIDVADYDGNVVTNSASRTVTVRQISSGGSGNSNTNTPRISNDRNLSSNNNLASLSIDGFNISPEFNKDTLEYSVELTAETTEVNIKASAEDDNSSITGIGGIAVNDGMNKLEVVVTAENGSTKTYVINANVLELEPITIEVDGKKYTVIRKKELLVSPNNYKETTVKINDIEVPALKGSVTKYTLVGLKNSNGDINLYIYNSKKNTYKLYKEIDFKGTRVYLLDMIKSKIPLGYVKGDLSYNGEKIVAYKQNSSSDFGLVYALNVDTGEKNLYVIDSKEGTIQRYNSITKTSKYNFLTLCLFATIGILFIIIIILIVKLIINKKKYNKTNVSPQISDKEKERLEKLVNKEKAKKTKNDPYDDMEKL